MPQSSVMSRMVILSKGFFKSIRFKEISKACFVAVDIAFTSLNYVVRLHYTKSLPECNRCIHGSPEDWLEGRCTDVCGWFPLTLSPSLSMTTCVEVEKLLLPVLEMNQIKYSAVRIPPQANEWIGEIESASMVELVDSEDLGSRAAMRAGSSPFRRTKPI